MSATKWSRMLAFIYNIVRKSGPHVYTLNYLNKIRDVTESQLNYGG